MKHRMNKILAAKIPLAIVFIAGLVALPFFCISAAIYVWAESTVKLLRRLFSSSAIQMVSLAQTWEIDILGDPVKKKDSSV